MTKNYYEILGITRNATPDQIKKAYRKLARKYHPDISKEANAEENMQAINVAYDTLSNEQKKTEYDFQLIMQISTVPPGFPSGMSHVIVIRGMFFQTTPMGVIPMLIVNDPMNQYTQPVPYAQLAPLWQSAIVVHN